jgi:TRAP-type C4-dicarboxylate transport system permease small subunit
VIPAIMAGAVFLQVVLRYLGLTGIDELEEMPRSLRVLVMIGSASATARPAHRARLFSSMPPGHASRALCLSSPTPSASSSSSI